MRKLNKILFLLGAGLLMLQLSSCNSVEGYGAPMLMGGMGGMGGGFAGPAMFGPSFGDFGDMGGYGGMGYGMGYGMGDDDD